MSLNWDREFAFLEVFSKDIQEGPPLPAADPDALARHAAGVMRLQDLLSLITTLPADKRPSIPRWDDLLGPLWREFFIKGDDIDRYVLGDLWRRVLRESGETERFLRSSAAVASSARNCCRPQEALSCCLEGRKASDGEDSAALVNLLNTEGTVYVVLRDFESAEATFRQALAIAERLPENAPLLHARISKVDLVAQEYMNIQGTQLQRGLEGPDSERTRWAERAEETIRAVSRMPLSGETRRMLDIDRATLALLRGEVEEAGVQLTGYLADPAVEKGPYRYSLKPMICRLLSLTAVIQEDWRSAYIWIRTALQEGVNHNFPVEDHLVLEQVIRILRGLHDIQDLKAQDTLVEDLSQLLVDKDWYTGGSHSRGVSRLSERIARILIADNQWAIDLQTMRKAGLLHDIGKLRIPWSLLNKIAPISPRERSILQDHSIHGGDILRQMGLDGLAAVVEQHHESLDGSGYPTGKPPSPMAAILAVCDVYEALTTPNRKYKDPKPRAAALAEICSESGTRFHPDVVNALVLIHERDAVIPETDGS